MLYYKPIKAAFRADEKSIMDLLELFAEEDFEHKNKEIVLQSETLHRLSKKGACCNYSLGYTSEEDGGKTYMIISGGVLRKIRINYVVYAKPNKYGVDSKIEKITNEDVVIYQVPEKATEAILLY